MQQNSMTIQQEALFVENAFLKKNPKRGIILKRYNEATGEDLVFSSLNKSKLEQFVDHLKDVVSNNSAKMYCAILKSFLNIHDDKLDLGKDWSSILDLRTEATSSVVLNDEEISLLIDFALNGDGTDTEIGVVSSFCVSALTGARWSDARTFKDMPLEVGKVFSYVSSKTGIKADVIVSKSLPALAKNTTDVSLVTFNNTIKNVCSKLGMKTPKKVFKGGVYHLGELCDFVSSHTARRSFATNLYNRGADLEVISKMMGHNSYNQTKKYIVSDFNNLNKNITDFFDK